MEEQDRRQSEQIPPITPQSYGKRLWRLWGPIVIKWGIGIGVGMMAMFALSAVYVGANYDIAVQAMENEDMMLEIYDKIFNQYLNYSTIIEGVAALATIPVMLLFFHRDRVSEKMKGIIPNRKAALWKYGAVIVMGLAMCMGFNNLIAIGNLSAMDEAYVQTAEALYSAPLVIQIVCLAILIPISEELVFRGLLFKRIRETGSFLQASLYSALVFGFMHMNMIQMLYGFLIGMVFAYMYEKYGSVRAPVLAHVVMNLFSVLATEFKLYEWMMKEPMWMGIATVLCATVAATMFVLIQKIDEKPENIEPKENLATE